MTISITVLVLETTGSLQLLAPIMLAVLSAKFTGDLFGQGIYDAHIRIRGSPFLPEHTEFGARTNLSKASPESVALSQ